GARAGGRSDHHHGGPRQRSDHAVHRSFTGSRAGVGARAAGAGAWPGGAGDVRGSGGDGGGVLRRGAARGGQLVPEGSLGVGAAGLALWRLPAAARRVRTRPGGDRRGPAERAALDACRAAPRCVRQGEPRPMRVRRVAWLATVLAGCVDQATAPGVCPTFCPSGQIDVVDTVLAASIARDSTFRGYVLPHQAGAMTASHVPGVVDSRAILRTSALVSGLALNTGDTTTSPLVGADSMKRTLTITRHDTTAHNLTGRLYRLPLPL